MIDPLDRAIRTVEVRDQARRRAEAAGWRATLAEVLVEDGVDPDAPLRRRTRLEALVARIRTRLGRG